jgi:hypothetical protein
MMGLSKKVWIAAGSVVVAASLLGAAVGGCSSSTPAATGGDSGGGGTKGDSGGTKTDGGGVTGGSGTCSAADDIFTVVFSPMYSAIIPGSSTPTFTIPAIATGIKGDVGWGPTDNPEISITADTSTGGVLITINPTYTGTYQPVNIVATSTTTSACGQSTLNITTGTLAQWQAGAARYNDAGPLPTGMGVRAVFDPPDAGNRYSCTNCHAAHGEDAGFGFGFNDVAHTPEQTGGFSDQDLLGIIQNGVVPGWSTDAATAADAGYFDTTIAMYSEWHRFHHWNLTGDEVQGIVLYLRSLTPEAQTGAASGGNFGGHGPPPDGGFPRPDGGFGHHDGGFEHHDGGAPPTGDAG